MTTLKTVSYEDDIIPGDVVAVQHGNNERREGLVIGSHIDYLGRQIVEVRLDAQEIYHAWVPTVTRVRRTVSYQRVPEPFPKARTVERRVYW